MKVPEFIKKIGTALSSAAAPIQAFLARQAKSFNAFKDRNPRFKRMWNILTHPTTTRVLGIAVAVAIAPLTGGFTLPLAVSISLSCAVGFSTTFYMGLQKYRLGKAKERLKAVRDIVAAKNKIEKLAHKDFSLYGQLQILRSERPELDLLLKPKPSELSEKPSRRLSLTVAESLYYEGIACFTVMTACFGIGGVFGFTTAIASGMSGFIGQTRTRLGISRELYNTKDDRRYESTKAGLGRLKASQEKELRMQSRALEAALKDAETNPGSLAEAYDARLKAEQARTSEPSAAGFVECFIGEINPFKKEAVEQHAEHQSATDTHSVAPGKTFTRPLKPEDTPPRNPKKVSGPNPDIA